MPSEYFFQKIQTVYHCRQSKVYALFENRGPDSTSYVYTEVVLLIPFRVEEKGSSRGLNTLPRDTQLGNIHSDIAETRDHSLYSVQTGFPEVETFQNPAVPPHVNSFSGLLSPLQLSFYIAASSLSKEG